MIIIEGWPYNNSSNKSESRKVSSLFRECNGSGVELKSLQRCIVRLTKALLKSLLELLIKFFLELSRVVLEQFASRQN